MININYTTGYAGTGKSTELLKKSETLPFDATVVIAPTHKALHRLKDSLPREIEIKTIHALLGWIPTINENATKVEHIDATAKLDRELGEYKHIIIDEAGMMSQEMLMELVSKLEVLTDYGENDKEVTLHLYLDPYQLLPVKGVQIEVDEEHTTVLTTQHRAESVDIVEMYTKFVKYLEGENDNDLTTPYSENVLPFSIYHFKEGDRLLAYTNAAVGKWNTAIAKVLGIKSYEGQDVQLGSLLEPVHCDAFIEPTVQELLVAYKDETLQLQNSNINAKFLLNAIEDLHKHKDISFIKSGQMIIPVIVGVNKAYVALKKAKAAAIEDRKMFKHVYTLGRAYTMDYTFASTVHKAQGSEFNTVFIDKEDIKKSIRNNYYGTYARLMYVALSRAKQKIFI